MYCSNCGAELANDIEKFCEFCGFELTNTNDNKKEELKIETNSSRLRRRCC
ncbi:MAG: zinc-ribbon domain-containing protein [Candidatus Thorarchaeota archaeon]